MRFLPWGKSEHRASYSNAAVDALLSSATAAKAEASATAAAATAVRAIADSFAVAIVSPPTLAQVLTPPLMVDMARRLLVTGNAVYMVDVDDIGALALVPASSFEVSGGYRPSTWLYKLELARPSGEPVTRVVPAEGVAHIKINPSRSSPWYGTSALGNLSATALAGLERSLGMDTAPPSGLLLPMPDGASQSVVDQAAQALMNGRGGISLLQSTSGGYGQGKDAAPKKDLEQVRFGPIVPAASITAHADLTISLLNSMGVSEQLYHGGGPGMREAARQLYLSVIAPLSSVVVHKLSRALNVSIELDFGALRAIDSSARARGVAVLVGAGMSLADATDIMGLVGD